MRLTPRPRGDLFEVIDEIDAPGLNGPEQVELAEWSGDCARNTRCDMELAFPVLQPGVVEQSGHGFEIDEALAVSNPFKPPFLPVARLKAGTMSSC